MEHQESELRRRCSSSVAGEGVILQVWLQLSIFPFPFPQKGTCPEGRTQLEQLKKLL